MYRSAIIAILILFMSSWALVQADEITLKSGEVIKECKVKKRKGKWSLTLLDGSRRTIKESDVAEHIVKPTIGDALNDRLKKAGKKDKAELLAIGKEAMAVGAKKVGSKALLKFLKLDRDNEEANALLGNEKCSDGKWRRGRTLEKYKAKAREAELKAKGWVKMKGGWVDPVTAQNLKDGLVKHEGKWYTKDHAANLKAGKIWHYGTWYEAADKANLDAGKLKFKGKWMDIGEINSKIRGSSDAWRLEGEHFVVIGQQGYEKILICLQQLENTWAPLTDIFGAAPSTAKRDKKIRVTLSKDAKIYSAAHGAVGNNDDRCALFSSANGAYYDNKADAILGYYYSISYMVQWTQQAAGCAFQARLIGYDACPSPFYDAIACYTQALYKGKYSCYSEMHFNGIREWTLSGDPFIMMEDYDLSTKLGAVAAERRFCRLGFLIHFLREKHPAVLRAMVAHVFTKSATKSSVVAMGRDMLKGKDLEKEFNDFLKKFQRTWQEPIPKAIM